MYSVDRKKIESRLTYFEKILQYLTKVQAAPKSEVEILALERAIHISIEAMLDVGNQMIDGFIMRDPGSYEDIIEIMRDEQVIEAEEAKKYIKWISCRKSIVAEYDQVDIQDLWRVYTDVKHSLDLFPKKVRAYLHNQLGPVSAFLPHE